MATLRLILPLTKGKNTLIIDGRSIIIPPNQKDIGVEATPLSHVQFGKESGYLADVFKFETLDSDPEPEILDSKILEPKDPEPKDLDPSILLTDPIIVNESL